MKERVLITGIAGFIGSNLADRLLDEGYEVVGIDDLSFGLKEQIPAKVKFYEADIVSKDIYPFFRGIDAVFHLAAKNSLSDCDHDPVETMRVNVLGTANVFQAAALAGVKKVMYAQSSVLEEGEARLKGFYAISKMAGMRLAEGFASAFGLTTVGLRYFNVYGPRQDYRRAMPPLMSKLIITLLKGEVPVSYRGDDRNKRDFVHVDDVNEFHLLCLKDSRVDGKTFKIGSGKSYSVQEIYEAVSDILGSKVEPEIKPRMAGDPIVVTKADIRAAARLGWRPKTPLRKGLEGMVGYIRAEMKKGNIKDK